MEERGDKLHLIPTRATVVKRIFRLAADGYGISGIVKKLMAERVPPFGRSGRWARSYIAIILKDRRAVGECQPRSKHGPQEPIPDYFPAVVTEEEFLVARAGAAQRRHRPGRMPVEGTINIFAGLVHNAVDGDSYFSINRRGRRILMNLAGLESRGGCRSFPYVPFERAILSQLAEVRPHEVLGGEDGPDEVQVLSGDLARVEAKIAELEAELLNGDVAALARVLREQEGRKHDLAAQLAEARQKAANPLSEVWGQTHSLLIVLDTAPDPSDVRMRLRSALQRIIEDIRLLVVPRNRDRLAAVQIWFTDDGHRDYLIFNRAARVNASARHEGGWWSRSLPPDLATGDFDLRNPAHAADLALRAGTGRSRRRQAADKGKSHDLKGRSLDMLVGLLNSRHHRCSALELRDKMGVNDVDVNYPEQVVKTTQARRGSRPTISARRSSSSTSTRATLRPVAPPRPATSATA